MVRRGICPKVREAREMSLYREAVSKALELAAVFYLAVAVAFVAFLLFH